MPSKRPPPSPSDLSWGALVESQLRQGGSNGCAGAKVMRTLSYSPRPRQFVLLSKDRQIAKIPLPLRAAIQAVSEARSSWPLLIYGPPGTGKTSAGLCMVDHVRGSIYQRFDELCANIQLARAGQLSYPDGRKCYPGNLWKEVEEAPLTVLDEVGLRGAVTDPQYETMLAYLQRREGKPYVVISNTDLAGIAEAFDYRVGSRLICATEVCCDWPDMRPGVG